jgi:hypothetical protein
VIPTEPGRYKTPYVFEIVCPDRRMVCCAYSEETRDDWILIIRARTARAPEFKRFVLSGGAGSGRESALQRTLRTLKERQWAAHAEQIRQKLSHHSNTFYPGTALDAASASASGAGMCAGHSHAGGREEGVADVCCVCVVCSQIEWRRSGERQVSAEQQWRWR